MASPSTQETVSMKQQQPAAIRKRRRRAPTGGAADDCFTCARRGVKCDRRRPYCSQCLEIGNECSGYKTQLTWGVGVASRGKLRGLSLPIAKAPPVAREPKKPSPPVSRPRAHSSAPYVPSAWRVAHEEPRGLDHRSPIDIPAHYQHLHQGHHQGHQHQQHQHQHQHHHQHTASTPAAPAFSMPPFDYLAMSSPNSTPSMPQSSWSSMASYSPGIMHSPDLAPRYSKFPLNISTDTLSSSVESIGSVGSVGSVASEVDYMSPLSQSYQREELPFSHSPTVLYDAYPAPNSSPISHSPPPVLVLDHCRAPTSYPGLVFSSTETGVGLGSHMDPFDTHLSHKMMREYDSLNEHHMAALPAFPF